MNSSYRFKLGEWSCTVLRDGGREVALEYLFPSLESTKLHEEAARLGFERTVMTGLNVLVVDTADGRIMIDSGLPNGMLASSMDEAGISANSIAHLIITHGDTDHVGGLHHFTGAKLYLPRLAWELWTDRDSRRQMIEEWDRALGVQRTPAERDRVAAERARFGTQVLPSLESRLTLVEPAQPFLPGIKMHYAPGHRSDHYAVEVSSRGESLLHVSDALRHPLQAEHPEWVDFYSTYPQQTTATAKRLLARAADGHMKLFCTHLAFPGLAKVTRSGLVFSMQQIAPHSA